MEKNSETTNALKNKNLGLIEYTFLSMAIIAPLAMIVGNASGAVSYAGMAAPLIPLIGAIFILFASLPILEYSRFLPFAGGYYGLAELGFGKAAGKWVALGYLASEIIASGVLQAGFIPFILFTSIQLVYHILLPMWLYYVIMVLILIWGFLSTIWNVRTSFKFIIYVVASELVIVILYSIIGLAYVFPHWTITPFLPSSSPTGWSGLFLGVVLAGFLFYGGYGTSLPFSEEGKSRETMWKALLLGIVISAVVGILGMYSEVVLIGPSNISTLASSVNPAVTAFFPLLGYIGVWILLIDYVFTIMIVSTGMMSAGARILYALGRDGFFDKKTNEKITKLDVKNIPRNAAIVVFILDFIVSIVLSALMFYLYGYYSGMFYVPFLAGSMFVAAWYFHHIVPDLAMMRALPKKFKQKLTTPRNLFISVISPLAGAAIFIYSFYEGYSSLTEPYLGGLIVILLMMVIFAIWVGIKQKRGTLGRSFIDEALLQEYLKQLKEKSN